MKKNYRVRHYTTREGLPQHSVVGIGFDKAGYCWLTTEMGFVRFDGSHFQVFNSNVLAGIRSNRFGLAGKDTSGNLILQNNLFQNIVIRSDNNPVTSPTPRLLDDAAAAYPVTGFLNYDPLIRKILDTSNARFKLLNPGNAGIYGIDKGKLYYITRDGLSLIYSSTDFNEWKYMLVNNAFLLYDPTNKWRIWKDGKTAPVISDIAGPLSENKAYKMGQFSCHYNNGVSYIFSGNTLYRIYENEGRLTSESLIEGLEIIAVADVYYHEESDSYFIGSLVSGLHVISLSEFDIPFAPGSTHDEGFYSQVLTSEGDIICQRYLYSNKRLPQKLPIGRFVGASLFLSRDQKLYYGDEPRLMCFNLTTYKKKIVAELEARPSSIFEDRTDTNTRVVVTAHAVRKVVNDTITFTRHLPFTQSVIRAVQTGKDSFILATSMGVKWYDLKNNHVYRSLLDSIYIRALGVETTNNVWIGTASSGSYFYENGQLYKIPDHGYPALQTVHSFVEDKNGIMWMPTNDGLFTIRRDILRQYALNRTPTPYYYRYSEFDDLPTNEFNGGCTPNYLWTTDRKLSLPSLAGLVQFYPEKMKPLLPANDIYVDEVRVNDSLILFKEQEKLILPASYGRLSIKVSCPYFLDRYNLRLQYKVEEISNNWRSVPLDGIILMDGAAAGSYHFIVRKPTDQPDDKGKILQFVVIVKPKFYNTWWFFLILSAALVAVLVILARVRIRLLKKRNKKLQDIIRRQTADLTKTVSLLRDSEQALKESNLAKDNIITIVLHDLRSPIRFLSTISRQLAKKLPAMKREEVENNISILKSGTDSLNSFTDQFFAWAVSQKQSFHIIKEQFALSELLTELDDLYSDIIATNNNKLVKPVTDIRLYTDKNILSVIIRNLLDNANKYTMNGVIEIAVENLNNRVSISVANSGNNLDVERIIAYYHSGSAANQNGNGSLIVADLLKKIDGTLSIGPREGGGIVVNIELSHHS